MKTILGLFSTAFVVLVLAGGTAAQSYSVDWFTLDGGGGLSTGGAYSLNGSIGQADAGSTMAGGAFSLTGGFWSIAAVAGPGAPVLKIFLTATNTAMVSWPSASTGFVLQENSQLGTSNWTGVAQAVADNGTNRFIIIGSPNGNRYYRLFKP